MIQRGNKNNHKVIKIGILVILFLVFILFPISKTRAETTNNLGFISGNIWYSQNSFEEGDAVRIYTAIFNPEDRELSGTVVFFDNNTFLGKKDFIVEAKSVKGVFIDWVVDVGNHNIFGKIENAKFFISKDNYESVYLSSNETSKSSKTVNKKIVATIPNIIDQNINVGSIIDTANTIGQNSIKNIGNVIDNNTPNFISNPVKVATNAVETFRQSIGTASKNKEEEVKKEIELLDSKQTENKESGKVKKTGIIEIEKPLKFTELLAIALFANIFENKFIFYTLLFLFIVLLLRYILNRIKSTK